MAILNSEDKNIQSNFEIKVLKEELKNKPNVSWISYKLYLTSGKNKLTFEKDTNASGSGDYVFSILPINELFILLTGIKNFIKNSETKLYSFEPLEPSFELIIERSYNGYTVTVWADAGNVISDHYTWDSFGLRFFTTENEIISFVNQLEIEVNEILEYAKTK